MPALVPGNEQQSGRRWRRQVSAAAQSARATALLRADYSLRTLQSEISRITQNSGGKSLNIVNVSPSHYGCASSTPMFAVPVCGALNDFPCSPALTTVFVGCASAARPIKAPIGHRKTHCLRRWRHEHKINTVRLNSSNTVTILEIVRWSYGANY